MVMGKLSSTRGTPSLDPSPQGGGRRLQVPGAMIADPAHPSPLRGGDGGGGRRSSSPSDVQEHGFALALKDDVEVHGIALALADQGVAAEGGEVGAGEERVLAVGLGLV